MPRGQRAEPFTTFDGLNELPLAPELAFTAEWYERYVVDVARDLLGCVVVSLLGEATVAGVIVETEAYDGEDDPACHSAFRRTGVVRAMWGPRGTAYIYRAHGIYPCFNVVAGPGMRPAAVLIRALQPLINGETMAERANKKVDARLAAGPGLTGKALGVDLSENGHPLQEAPVWIQPGVATFDIVTGRRIGISRGVEAEWRFGVRGSPALSRRFP